jgi:glycosyltransferase involved in cell wall biosynthesis
MNKVCHLTSAHPPNDVRIFHKECLALYKKGYQVMLLANGNSVFDPEQVDVMGIQLPGNRLLRILFSPWLFLIRSLKKRAAVYHLHDPELLPVGFMLKLAGKKVIYDAHENTSLQILTKYYLSGWMRKPASRVVRMVEDLSARFFDAVITTSRPIKEAFPASRQHKVMIVGNYPRADEFVGISHDQKEHSVCYVGAMSEARGLYAMMESLSYHEARLEMAGRFYPPGLHQAVLRDKNQDRIRYHGVMDRPGIERIYRISKIGLLPLLPNPHHHVILPIKLFEYMAAGLPVVASNFPLWREIVEGTGCGWCVDPEDPEAMGNTIARLLGDQALRKRMGQKGRHAVEQFYNWESQEKVLWQLYNQITG